MAHYTLKLFSKLEGNYLFVIGSMMHKQYMTNMQKMCNFGKLRRKAVG